MVEDFDHPPRPTVASMSFILHPWQLLLIILAGWINQQQQEVIEYLRTENQVLTEKLGKKRILLSDDQRRRLAVAGKIACCRHSVGKSNIPVDDRFPCVARFPAVPRLVVAT